MVKRKHVPVVLTVAAVGLGVGIGMAYVPVGYAEPGRIVHVEIRGRRFPAELVKKPIYRKPAA